MVTTKDTYEIGEIPPLGEVPKYMYAQLIRPERFGEPKKAFQVEQVETPAELKPREALVLVMAAGINYNNVWAARGIPVNVIKAREKEGDTTGFHIGGSDASGIVYAVGDARHEHQGRRPGRHPLRHVGRGRAVREGRQRPDVRRRRSASGATRPTGAASRSSRRCRRTSACPRPPHLTWEEAAAPMLVGATAYRMLTRLAAAHRRDGRRRARLGRLRRPRLDGDPDRPRVRRRSRSPSSRARTSSTSA